MKELSEVVNTAFGTLVAYVLPGLAMLIALALFSQDVANLLEGFKQAESTVGLFFFVACIALTLGMQLAACRWFLFEVCIDNENKFDPTDFEALKSEEISKTFRLIVIELYRHHQFYGAQFFVLPILAFGVFIHVHIQLGEIGGIFYWALLVLLEFITYKAAAEGLDRYFLRGKSVLKRQESL